MEVLKRFLGLGYKLKTVKLLTMALSSDFVFKFDVLPVPILGHYASVSLYQGTVWHERRRPLHHYFQYSVRYALIDLDHAHHAPPDRLSASQARSFCGTNGPVFLLTIPPSVGYEQNPLSVYYCYDVEGSSQHLKKCIAEVTNTPWGERISFLFNPDSDMVAKALHVSPFNDMLGSWRIKTNAPGENILVTVSVNHPTHGDYFTASLVAKRVSSSTPMDHTLFFWLMPHKVAFWIYWQALKLWWKGLSFVQHPRYYNPGYRGEALARDEKLHCCKEFAFNSHTHQEAEESRSRSSRDSNSRTHCFTWRDAKWPWC
nr:TBC1 domain family member 14 like [Ipomoea batatas]